MIYRTMILPGLLLTLLNTGCSSLSNTAQGGLIGSGLGAGVGALAGSGSGNAGKGALIGGLAGGLLGGVVGNDVDQQEKRQVQGELARERARPTSAPLGITDVQVLAAKGWTDDMILAHLRDTRSSFQLSTSDIQWLRDNGVSDRVIQEMMSMKPRGNGGQPTTVIYREPVPTRVIYQRVEPVYVYPAPPPPIYGVGVSIRR